MMRISHARAKDSPAPAAAPGRAASVGLGILNSFPAVPRWCNRCWWIAPSIVLSPTVPSPDRAMPFTSPPAQKPFPAPVNTTTFTLGLTSKSASMACNAAFISPDIALRACGLFNVNMAIPSSSVANKSCVPVSISVITLHSRIP